LGRLRRAASAIDGLRRSGADNRLVAAIDFDKGIVLWIKWIGSHADYDRIDVKEVKHGG
jgi:mRNA interferase HigB